MKTSKLGVTGLCAANSPVTVEFPAQRASNAENVSIWWRHHVGQGDWACLVDTDGHYNPGTLPFLPSPAVVLKIGYKFYLDLYLEREHQCRSNGQLSDIYYYWLQCPIMGDNALWLATMSYWWQFPIIGNNDPYILDITATLHERHVVSDHRQHDSLFNRLFRLTSNKTSTPALLVPYDGNPPVDSPHKGQ